MMNKDQDHQEVFMKEVVPILALENEIGIYEVYKAKSNLHYETQTRITVCVNTLDIKQNQTEK